MDECTPLAGGVFAETLGDIAKFDAERREAGPCNTPWGRTPRVPRGDSMVHRSHCGFNGTPVTLWVHWYTSHTVSMSPKP